MAKILSTLQSKLDISFLEVYFEVMKVGAQQKSFIQIPILIAITVGLVLLGGAGYFGYQQIESYESRQATQEEQVQESISSQERNIEKASSDQEVEGAVKVEQEAEIQVEQKIPTETEAKDPNKKESVSLVESDTTYSTLIQKWAPATVKLTCTTDTYNSQSSLGSGSLFYVNETTYTVFTNWHVIATDDESEPFCIVTIYPNSPSLAGALAYKSKAGSFGSFGAHLDMATFDIEPTPYEIGIELFGQALSIPLSRLRTLAISNTEKPCSLPQLGDVMLIFGYPSIGGDSITVTEGIVAGIENNLDGATYYKTSAKIEQGNSGGVAVNIEKGCFLGVPTLSSIGQIESLAFVLPIQ